MKDNQAKYPQLRFKGFTDPWVQRNLADLSDGFSYGLNAAAKEYDGVHGYLRITDIDEVSHSFLPEGLTSPDVPENQLTDYRMDEQSIVYARTGASTGKTYIYRDSDGELYYAGFLIRQKVNKETSAQFVYQNTLTKAWERYVQVMSQRSGQPGINAQEVGRFELAIPEKAEQDKIAHLFNSLDNLIAANQRKLDLLKEQKKGYLQKMFPKNGSKFPQLRFAGFADAWEQRKLGEIAIRVRGNDGRMNLPTLTISAGNGWMDQRDRFSQNIAGKEQKNYTLLRQGELSYNHGNSKLAQFGAVFELESYNEALVPRVYHSFSVTAGAQPKFIEQMFATHRPDRELRKLVSSGARMDGLLNINYDDFMGIKVWLPSVAEQQAIAGLLVKLDNTIALHQRKLEKLQELKKGYLQKMFC